MVDPVTNRPMAKLPLNGASAAGVGTAKAADSAIAPGRARTDGNTAGAVTRALSEHPPVQYGRVEELRNAIRAGNYPVQPDRIADAMVRSLNG